MTMHCARVQAGIEASRKPWPELVIMIDPAPLLRPSMIPITRTITTTTRIVMVGQDKNDIVNAPFRGIVVWIDYDTNSPDGADADMSENLKIAVIMAGGAGERFWPLSRQDHPKQLLRLTSETESMIEEAVNRIAELVPAEQVFIVTARHLVDAIRASDTGIPPGNVLGEPLKRNTAGCLAFATAHVLSRFETEKITMAVLTADHMIGDPARFRDTVDVAMRGAETESALATIGVVPTRPETGYGYIEIANDLRPPGNEPESGESHAIFAVDCFCEKPDAATACEWSVSGRHFWNSGMFFWTVETFLRELEKSAPVHAIATRDMAGALRARDSWKVHEIFESLPDISIDYALMEKAGKVIMVRAVFTWDDIGTLDALARCRVADENGNISHGDPILIDTHGCIVYNEPGAAGMAVAAVGVRDLAIVTTRDGVLVLPRDQAQDVRKVVAALKESGSVHV
jgi:mannose-1-phosphate guanylyltransferase